MIDRDEAYRVISERWKIPEKKFADIILDFFTREDELLVLIAKLLISIDDKLDNIGGGQVVVDVSGLRNEINRLVASINSLKYSLEQSLQNINIGIAEIKNRPIEYIGGDRKAISEGESWMYDIYGGDIIMIHNIGNKRIHYMFGSAPSLSSPAVEPSGAIAITIPKKYSTLFISAPYGDSEVIISEWRYV